jgi:hypothetical protein
MLMQRLAELAQRSGPNPFVVVCLFHIAFSSYAAQLSASSQREWEKVAGRFEEIPFSHPLEQSAELVAAALRVETSRVPKSLLSEGKAVAEQACQNYWFGASSSKTAWGKLVPPLFPLDPIMFPVAIRFFQRFAQHERSLFNFMFSHEPFGLRAFTARPLSEADWFRLPDFFDYVRTNFSQRLSQTSYRTRWPVVEAVLDSATDLPEIEKMILKTVGLLNVLNVDDLRPTESILTFAIAGSDVARHGDVRRALEGLRKQHRIFFRGEGRGFCVWPYSSVDLDRALEKARTEIREISSTAASIRSLLPEQALVARRHYIETGNLRHFCVRYVSCEDTREWCSDDQQKTGADGRVIVVLCDEEPQRKEALVAAAKITAEEALTLVAVTRPLKQLRGYILEAQRWEWVSTHTLELNTDRYAADEVSRQLEHARDNLNRRLAEYIGLERKSGTSTLCWFRDGHSLERVQCGRTLLQELSQICSERFHDAPCVFNELLNRHSLSPAASGARMRLIERVLTQAHVPLLGIPEGTHPPEMSMYLSVLDRAGLHRPADSEWGIRIPSSKEEDPCNLRHSFNFLREQLASASGNRIPLLLLYRGLSSPPLGVRQGMHPLLVALLFAAHGPELAFYERGSFVTEADADMFLRLSKVPEIFELQWCRIQGVRAEILEGLRQVVSLPPAKSKRTQLLDIVRPLCQFAADLPEYTKRTRLLSPTTQAVRAALFSAQDPLRLLMHQLPEACGLSPFSHEKHTQMPSADNFVRRLHTALNELSLAYGEMLHRLERQISSQFRLSKLDDDKAREEVIDRATRLKKRLREPRLLAFVNTLADKNLVGSKWVASVASNLVVKTPATWTDADEIKFESELADLVGRFLRVENVSFGEFSPPKDGQLFRVAITQADGSEVAEVLHLSPSDESRMKVLEETFGSLLKEEGTVALIAVARQLGLNLKRKSV